MDQKTKNVVVLAIFLLVMTATRLPLSASVLHLQDASWAVFFLAGFYLQKQWRWALPGLMAGAVGIDLIAIQSMGISNYCVTAAYWFLVPAYASLWCGGSWLRERLSMDARGLGRLVASLFVSVSVCFLISNASFYWIDDRVAERTLDGWLHNFSTWYWPFLRVPFLYVGIAALVHAIVVQTHRLALPDRLQKR